MNRIIRALPIAALALFLIPTLSAQDLDKAKADAEKAKAAADKAKAEARQAEAKVKDLEEKSKTDERLKQAALVLDEMVKDQDKGIPSDLLKKAECAVVVPGLKKAAFLFGGRSGRGFVLCRPEDGKGWSAPAAVRIEGGSFGFQAGVTEIDLIMLIMNRSGKEKLFGNRFTLGASATGAAGPVGRSVSGATDVQMRAEILTWSRSRGAFAGVSLDGATLREDEKANSALYGLAPKEKTNRQIVVEMKPTAGGQELVSTLSKYSAERMP